MARVKYGCKKKNQDNSDNRKRILTAHWICVKMVCSTYADVKPESYVDVNVSFIYNYIHDINDI